MSIQNIKKALFMGAISLFSFNAHAQIEKGATSLGGTLQYGTGKFTSSSSSSTFSSLTIAPSYGRFITDKIMVKGQLSSIFSKTNIDNNEINNNNMDYKSNTKLLNIEAEARYYFNPAAKWKFFGGASLGKSFGNSTFTTLQNNNAISSNDYKLDKFNYSVFGGVNKFINSDIALEAKLGYSTTIDDLPFRGLAFQGKTRNIGLNIGLNNFTNFKTTDKNFVGLIDKGRTIINGNLSINGYNQKYENNSYQNKGIYAKIDLEYGQFVTKGLLVGAKANFIFEKYNQSYSVTPYAQYFYPVSKRLMLHAKAEIQGSINQNNTASFTFRGAAGLTYFLSKNVVLSADILNFSKSLIKSTTSPQWQNRSFTPNIGLRFFLK